ncbi:S24 family peptidase [Phocaeicola sp.]
MLKNNEYIQVLNHPKATEKKLSDQEVNLYDISAAANLKTLLLNKDQNILGKISIPDMPKCDGAVFVTGDSMYPLLKSGDIVVYKEVKDFEGVIFGEMYLVSFELFGDDYLAVKYVNRSEKEGFVKLVSYNTHHDPKDIPISAIRAMALVKLSIRKNTMI